MTRVVWDRSQEVGEWVARRIGGTFNVAGATAIGQERNGVLVAGCIFESYRKRSVTVHVAGEGKRWLTREFAHAVFGYCFNQLRVDKIIGPVDSSNADAMKFDEHLGFFPEAVISGAAEGGDLIIYTMTRQQCRYLGRDQ